MISPNIFGKSTLSTTYMKYSFVIFLFKDMLYYRFVVRILSIPFKELIFRVFERCEKVIPIRFLLKLWILVRKNIHQQCYYIWIYSIIFKFIYGRINQKDLARVQWTRTINATSGSHVRPLSFKWIRRTFKWHKIWWKLEWL